MYVTSLGAGQQGLSMYICMIHWIFFHFSILIHLWSLMCHWCCLRQELLGIRYLPYPFWHICMLFSMRLGLASILASQWVVYWSFLFLFPSFFLYLFLSFLSFLTFFNNLFTQNSKTRWSVDLISKINLLFFTDLFFFSFFHVSFLENLDKSSRQEQKHQQEQEQEHVQKQEKEQRFPFSYVWLSWPPIFPEQRRTARNLATIKRNHTFQPRMFDFVSSMW